MSEVMTDYTEVRINPFRRTIAALSVLAMLGTPGCSIFESGEADALAGKSSVGFEAGGFTEQQRQGLVDSTLQLQTDQGTCTATIVNRILLSAGHCAEGNGKQISRANIYSWRDGFGEEVAHINGWSWYQDEDVMAGVLTSGTINANSWIISQIDDNEPKSGDSFFVSSLPGDAKTPHTGALTYLGKQDGKTGRAFVFAYAGNPNDTGHMVAEPGASGSLITNGGGKVFILTSSLAGMGVGAANGKWAENRQYYGGLFNFDLSNTTEIVFATHVTQSMLKDLVFAAVENHEIK